MRTGLEHQREAAHAGARIPVPQVREERTTGYRDGCDVCPIEEWCLERKEEMKDVRD